MATRYLCIDTSTSQVLAEIVRQDGDILEVISSAVTDGATKHGEALAPNIDAALRGAGLQPRDLDAIVVGLGPGPFTGLRVGIVTAASMSDALGIPVYGVCSLDGFEVGDGQVLVATDARRKEIYWATYADGRRTAGPAVDKPQVVVDAAGDRTYDMVQLAGADKYADVLEPLGPTRAGFPTGRGLLAAAQHDGLSTPALTPLYLRRPDATVPAASKKSATQPTAEQLRSGPR